jgi:hypothetical protein
MVRVRTVSSVRSDWISRCLSVGRVRSGFFGFRSCFSCLVRIWVKNYGMCLVHELLSHPDLRINLYTSHMSVRIKFHTYDD